MTGQGTFPKVTAASQLDLEQPLEPVISHRIYLCRSSIGQPSMCEARDAKQAEPGRNVKASTQMEDVVV